MNHASELNIVSCTPPWLLWSSAARAELSIFVGDLPKRVIGNLVVSQVDGSRMGTWAGLHEEFARALDFPDYYGRNLAAMRDCLSDAQGDCRLIIVWNANSVLVEEEADALMALLRVLHESCNRWSSARDEGGGWLGLAKPFHCLFHDLADRKDEFMGRAMFPDQFERRIGTSAWGDLSLQ